LDAVTGKELFTFQGHTDWIMRLAFSPDGKRLASAGSDESVTIRDMAASKQEITFKAHTNGVQSVAFSPDGKRLVTASRDDTVKVWELAKLP
jgi:WD40 repeat protein